MPPDLYGGALAAQTAQFGRRGSFGAASRGARGQYRRSSAPPAATLRASFAREMSCMARRRRPSSRSAGGSNVARDANDALAAIAARCCGRRRRPGGVTERYGAPAARDAISEATRTAGCGNCWIRWEEAGSNGPNSRGGSRTYGKESGDGSREANVVAFEN